MNCCKSSGTITMRFSCRGELTLHDLLTRVICVHFRWVKQFLEIFEADNYHPIQISGLVQYQDITSSFPYQNPSLESAPFPKQFPFSAMVPRVYTAVQEFILSCLQFSEDLQLTQAELGIECLNEYSSLIS